MDEARGVALGGDVGLPGIEFTEAGALFEGLAHRRALLSVDGTARVAEAWVRLRPGMRASVPLGALGECGVEAE